MSSEAFGWFNASMGLTMMVAYLVTFQKIKERALSQGGERMVSKARKAFALVFVVALALDITLGKLAGWPMLFVSSHGHQVALSAENLVAPVLVYLILICGLSWALIPVMIAKQQRRGQSKAN